MVERLANAVGEHEVEVLPEVSESEPLSVLVDPVSPQSGHGGLTEGYRGGSPCSLEGRNLARDL